MNFIQKILCQWFKIGCPKPEPMPASLPPCRPGIEYGYYGGGDAYDHVTVQHIGSWGDWSEAGRGTLIDGMITQAQDAVVHGVTKLIFTLDFCLFTQTNPRELLPPSISLQYLGEFFARIRREGLWPNVFAWYPIDEPNIPEIGLNATDLFTATNRIRVQDPDRHPFLCIFGWIDGKFPGIESFDWVGFDNYGQPIFTNGMYDKLLDSLHPNQKTILVPGGASPWHENPYPFYKAAQGQEVALVMPFIWITPEGIATNGEAETYRKVGLAIKGAK